MVRIEKIETKIYEEKDLPQIFVNVFTDDGLIGTGEACSGSVRQTG